jgi:hypothetical protein
VGPSLHPSGRQAALRREIEVRGPHARRHVDLPARRRHRHAIVAGRSLLRCRVTRDLSKLVSWETPSLPSLASVLETGSRSHGANPMDPSGLDV